MQSFESQSTNNGIRTGNKERRTNLRLAAFRCWYRNRRKHLRRNQDQLIGGYVDIHEPWLLYVCLLILALSMADAFFTLTLLQYGSRELNPLMDLLIQYDTQLFITVKFVISACCIFILVMHKNFRLLKLIKGYHIIAAYGLSYLTLVVYEVSLLVFVVPA